MSSNGVTYPAGFRAAGVACGLKKNNALDLAVVISDVPATAAAVFTRNVVKGHSLQVSRRNVQAGTARVCIINSGCANACIGQRGWDDAIAITQMVAEKVGCAPEEVLPSSTGVIGVPLPMENLSFGIAAACAHASPAGGADASRAIMTTDTHPKEVHACFMLEGREIHLGGMAKGSGMIHPDMATMISVLTTDAAIEREALDAALREAVSSTYNRISVDGDTSVCDQVTILANGQAGNSPIVKGTAAFDTFVDVLTGMARELAKMLAADGEGATKLLTITIQHAPSDHDAHLIAAAIAKSPLCKTAAYGQDANWGRLMTAAGYSGAMFDPEKVDVYIGDIQVCQNGVAKDFDEEQALKVLSEKEVEYTLDFKQGEGFDQMYTCDMTHEYITINGSYRS